MLVLGVDPGTATTGYGLVRERAGRLETLGYGVIRTPKEAALADRLLTIHEEIGRLITEHDPDAVAVEELFFNRNVSTAMSVGHARGVILVTAAAAGKLVAEYSPPEVKQAVAGYGAADKAQMQSMVRLLLGLRETPKPDDAADALAVAICCLHSRRLEQLIAGRGTPDGKGGPRP